MGEKSTRELNKIYTFLLIEKINLNFLNINDDLNLNAKSKIEFSDRKMCLNNNYS